MSAIDDVQEEVKPDMTPMIDCVFLMIIFFLCIEFKVLEAKLPAYLPKDKGSQSTQVEPMEQLSVGIYVESAGKPVSFEGHPVDAINPNNNRPFRYKVDGYKVKWVVGPKPLYDIQAVQAELKRIVTDPNSQVPDPKNPGTKKLMPVVIEPHPGVYYESVARTADACNDAGFEEVNFGGGLGSGADAPKKGD
ncbi:MAG: biopolymer transporter ExbD [Planctomycetes bacterium]|nr:biopolymer transporter ExbD [Planctomycetota bacterium]